MKNTLILIIIFILLGGGTYWLIQKNKESGQSSVLPMERDFAIKNIEDIGKIFLVDRDGHRTLLERIGNSDEWRYNKKYKARANAMENLLRAVKEIEMRYQPAEAAKKNIMNSIATKGIKVEIYDKKGEKMKTYYIGGAPNDELGTYAIIDGAEQPMVIHIPTFSGNVRFRYNLNGDDWRDRHIFDAPLEKIEEVSVEYPSQKDKSFRIIKRADGYDVSPYYDIAPKYTGQPNQKIIETYLLTLPEKQIMGFENEYTQKETAKKGAPFCTITLKTSDGKEQSLSVWPQWSAPAVNDDAEQTNANPNVTRYFGEMNGKDFVSLSYNTIRPYFAEYDSFFK